MGTRRGGRGLDTETALRVALDGTSRRHADENTPILEAVAHLRELAGDRVDMLAVTAGSMIGAYLGSPMTNPNTLAAAHLLVLASDGERHDLLVAQADVVRARMGKGGYSLVKGD